MGVCQNPTTITKTDLGGALWCVSAGNFQKQKEISTCEYEGEGRGVLAFSVKRKTEGGARFVGIRYLTNYNAP